MRDDAGLEAKRERFEVLLADRARRRKLLEEQTEEERALNGEREPLEKDLAAYLRFVWSILKPSQPLQWSWHYEYLSEYLQLVYERKILYFIANVPPRTLKTVHLSVAFPTWVWIKDQVPSFIFASFDMGLSTKINVMRRKVLLSHQFQRLFGHRLRLVRGSNEKDDFANINGGEMLVTSPDANITGRGGDFAIMDDILPPSKVDSPQISQTVFDWIDETFMQRRNDLSRSPFALIEQRVGEKDATYHLLKTLPAEKVVHINIPLIEEERREYRFPISGRVHVREAGDVLLPGAFTPEVIAGLKLRMRIFSTQYQGKPLAKGGKTFKREWFRFYGPKGSEYPQLPEKFDEICQSWDLAFKKKEDSDQVAGHVYGRKGPDTYLLDRRTEQLTFTETIKAIIAMRAKWPKARRIYIEDKANGPAVIDVLKERISGIIAVEPMGSKEARADASSANVESGNVFLPCPELAPWINSFLDILCAFPGPINDDDVDAFSQAILKMKTPGSGILAMYEQQNEREAEMNPIRTIFEQFE